jgi:hypothetical protein
MADVTKKHKRMAADYIFRVDSEVIRQFIADGGADQVAQALADMEAEVVSNQMSGSPAALQGEANAWAKIREWCAVKPYEARGHLNDVGRRFMLTMEEEYEEGPEVTLLFTLCAFDGKDVVVGFNGSGALRLAANWCEQQLAKERPSNQPMVPSEGDQMYEFPAVVGTPIFIPDYDVRLGSNGACLGCYSAGAHIDALHELICSAAPLGWAATGDQQAAAEWEKRAVELMARYERTTKGEPPPDVEKDL